MSNSCTSSGQSDAADEEDGEHDVGEERREVDDLAGALDPLHYDEEDDCPGEQEAQHDPPFEAARVIDGRADV